MREVAVATWVLAGYGVSLTLAAVAVDALLGRRDQRSGGARTETARFFHGIAVGMVCAGLLAMVAGAALNHDLADLVVLGAGILIALSVAAHLLSDLRSSSAVGDPARAGADS